MNRPSTNVFQSAGLRRFIDAINHNKNMKNPTGTFWFIDCSTPPPKGGEPLKIEIAESHARTLIATHYPDGQHRDFPQWDGALLSLGANQFVRFEEARIAQPAFVRERRYMVLKLSDVARYLDPAEQKELARMGDVIARCRRLVARGDLECVVVESDWPEYEPTWKAIEERMS